MIYLNIGLEGAPAERVSRMIANSILGSMHVKSIETRQSSSEPTLVVELYSDLPPGLVYRLSEALSQDCIAYWNAEVEQGLLIGPRAYPEGFNGHFFVMPDGTRLLEKEGSIPMG